MTPEQFKSKVENEGGLYEAVAGYGLTHRDLNRLDDPGFYDAVEAYVAAVAGIQEIEHEVESYLSEFEYEEE